MTAPATGVAPGPVTVKVVPLMVAAFMASLNVPETSVLTGTTVALLAGIVETMVGTPVLKLHTKLAASALPNVSLAPVVSRAVRRSYGGHSRRG